VAVVDQLGHRHPIVPLDQRTVGVREPAEIDVIIFGHHVVEAVEHLIQSS
jgi:hypothetical protein